MYIPTINHKMITTATMSVFTRLTIPSLTTTSTSTFPTGTTKTTKDDNKSSVASITLIIQLRTSIKKSSSLNLKKTEREREMGAPNHPKSMHEQIHTPISSREETEPHPHLDIDFP
jgi:hypothetical protein